MQKIVNRLSILVVLMGFWSCGKKESDPQVQLPSYLRVPATLAGYAGSGQFKLSGDLNLLAEGPQQLDASTNTYFGVQGDLSQITGITAQFTVGQPLPYNQSGAVPADRRANGVLSVISATGTGTYPMGTDSRPTSTGVIADLTMNLPGPQLYYTRSGSLTVTDKTLIAQQNGNSLYRLTGNFTAVLNASGLATTPGQAINTTGSFDLLLLAN